MRVITGSAKGIRLMSPEGMGVRPTSDMVKEAMFSAIQFETEGKIVLDLFAGSGQLGIEALSRGAKKAYFVDSDKKSAELIRANLEKTGLADKGQVFNIPHMTFLKLFSRSADDASPFELVFLDPPYRRGLILKTLNVLVGLLSETGIIVCEHERGETLPENVGEFCLNKTYKKGTREITLYRKRV
ncbi:MAG: 16S rRNA (guanine(966)-N(2))-methyltransferase RsmD [Oscillospiraceae bacterium]|nr:16S rRNA (guanine(966)-N(2))-methyltransferase RsmD [Oscillospiraceae bacterium]